MPAEAPGASRASDVAVRGASLWRMRPLWCALIMVLVVACSGGDNRADDETDERPSTSAETTETTAVASNAEEQEVIDAYLAAQEAMKDASADPGRDYPLEQTHIGPMLDQRQRVLDGLAADGLAIEYPTDSQYRQVVSFLRFEDDVAYLEVCAVDDGRRVNVASGEIVAGGGVSTVLWTAAMQRDQEAWKLAERREEDRQEGVSRCPGE